MRIESGKRRTTAVSKLRSGDVFRTSADAPELWIRGDRFDDGLLVCVNLATGHVGGFGEDAKVVQVSAVVVVEDGSP